MKTSTTLTACVAALWLFAAAALQADQCEPWEITIRLQIDRSLRSRVVVPDLQNETDAVWRPYGVHIAWMNALASESSAPGLVLEVSVVRRIDDADARQRPPTLGHAFVERDGAVTRPIRVAFDSTEEALALRKSSRTAIAGIVHDRELARALGRVLAHEIGHVLLAAPYHGTRGLMRAVFRPDELGGERRSPFQLTLWDVSRLRSRHRVLTVHGVDGVIPDDKASRQQ